MEVTKQTQIEQVAKPSPKAHKWLGFIGSTICATLLSAHGVGWLVRGASGWSAVLASLAILFGVSAVLAIWFGRRSSEPKS